MINKNVRNTLQTTHYFPFQPGLKSNTDYYIELKPSQDSAQLPIILFYQFKIDHLKDWVPALPDGCIEFIFCCNPNKPTAHIYGSLLQIKQLHFQPGYDHFGVRILPEHAIKFVNNAMPDIIDKKLPLCNIISLEDSIVDRIAEQNSFLKRIELFEKIGKFINFREIPKIVDYSIKKIYLSKGNFNMKDLVEDTGYSDRYLRMKFVEIVGIPPKLFSQIIRFQKAFFLLTNEHTSFSDVVDEFGYCDQAHLINDFKKFNLLKPAQLKNNTIITK
ncbi:helix-turn-helix domain-containing protein [Peribacillus butanolivorans]|uniref:helix-turn-helix domain-containing protein n=1 Tax=Peribacillus butanolivorans TaxID=421767 RepID=UPI00380756C5